MKIKLFITALLLFFSSSVFAQPLCVQTIPKYIADKYMNTYKYNDKQVEYDNHGNEILIIRYMNPDRYQDIAWAYFSIVRQENGINECILEKFDQYDPINNSRITVWRRGAKKSI